MVLDYIVVGQGIAGTCFAAELLKQNKSFVVIDDKDEKSASRVSAGLFNPIVLKRFTLVWRAEEQLNQLMETYRYFEKLLQQNYLQYQPVYRIFHNEAEKDLWNKKAQREDLSPYLEIAIENKNKDIQVHSFMGKVLHTGKVHIQELLNDFRQFLVNQNLIKEEKFNYTQLTLKKEENIVSYKNIKAKRIVFCEGYGMKQNPFFKNLPLLGNKGEVLLVKLKQPITDAVYKSKIFISHYNQDINYIGATYNWIDKDTLPSVEAHQFLTENLTKIYTQEYQIQEHLVGIRATVEDRRPLIGEHPQDKRLVVFNGLGTRGIMIAPLMAKELLHALENNIPIDSDYSIKRFNTNFAQI